ncbi:CD225/dispanin family protein [Antrihabitans cavernicola]|uniref:CD225/dispanin family protein n=1 Tax=Antrihabitans cavernicola TaxID=2495913 RepID=A0A5A7S8D4_9NOCA|nr:CD225/dispanin family protein [Spelaeibacter cavernicola]KAA0021412.1 CD225/dispanin family protein [Spelaeibacter cavernicola]
MSEQAPYQGGPQYPAGQYSQQQFLPPPPPKSNAGWAVASVVFFWPLAFSAFTHALNVYPRWAQGDFAGAQYASDRTKKLGQISLAIFAAAMILFVLFYIILIVAVVNGIDDTGTSSNW